MQTSSFKLRLLASTVIVNAALVASVASAQTAPASDGADIVVTGSRIQRPNLESTSPLSSVSAEEVKLKGTTNTEEILNSLPQVYAEQGNNLSISSTGIATVNMRNLGPSRTLVLINGRRLMPGDPTQLAADLNTVPSALIKRVDVVTGGASSVYGSDAVAGVVNFVMDTKFKGFRLDLDDGFNWDSNNNTYMQGLIAAAFGANKVPKGSVTDGVQRGATLTLGASFDDDRGHFTAYAGYHESHPVVQASRDYSYCALNVDDATLPRYCGGSSTSAPTNYTFNIGGANKTVGGDGTAATKSIYNYAALSYQQRQGSRYNGGVFADYEVSEMFHPYLEFMMTDDQSNAQFGPSGAFSVPVAVPCAGAPGAYTSTNPLVPQAILNAACPGATAGVATIRVRRRNVEGGGRINDFHHTAYRIVAGAKGKINDAWSYDIYGQYGSTIYQQNLQNYLSNQRMTNALTVVGTKASPVCAGGTADGCVPWDVWNNSPSAASLKYIAVNPIFNGNTKEQIVSGSINGDLSGYGLKTPWAKDGASMAIGAEYRKERLVSQPDSLFSSGDVAGLSANPAPLDVSFNVKEVFGELHMPIAADQPMAYRLAFDASYRYSDYSLSGSASAYKFGLTYAPIKELTIRGSYNRAVRAPNLLELYQPVGIGLWAGVDPCAGATPKLTQAQCARTGMTAAQYGNVDFGTAAQYDANVGGNPNLKPEKSDTMSLGFVFQPGEMLKGFSFTMDWFNIKVQNFLQPGLSASFVIAQCALNTGPVASDPLCNMIHRSSGGDFQNGDGSDGVDQYWLNTGKLTVRGIDFSAAYATSLGNMGKLNFDLNGTLMSQYTSVPIPGSSQSYNCVGYFGAVCTVPVPKWRHTLRTTWKTPVNVTASLNWRYVGAVTNDAINANPILQHPSTVAPEDLHIGAKSYFDLALTWEATKYLTLRGSINNILDSRPPIITTSATDGTYANGNTYPGIYDPLGRLVHFSATIKF